MFLIREVVEITEGRLVSGRPATTVRRLWTDSRTARRGDLFVALAGAHFDGQKYVRDALSKGAVGALVRPGFTAEGRSSAGQTAALIEVADPLRAYQALAGAHRRRFTIPVLAVSGSNGKTTTKEMIGLILSARYPTLVTRGNLNNHIGVPQTLLQLTPRHRAAVIEMGISGRGELTRLCEIAAPTAGLLTNIGPTHLETLGTIETVAQAKGELLEALPASGTAILNADDDFFPLLRGKVRGRVLTFGFGPRAQVRAVGGVPLGPSATKIQVRVRGRVRPFSLTLRVAGRHNVANALAAVAAGLALGVGVGRISAGLARYRPGAMRSEVSRWRGVTILKDCYNANPASVRAAIQWLSDCRGSGRTFAVLGDMLELGATAESAHREIGRSLAGRVDYVLTLGRLGAEIAEGAQAAGLPEKRVLTAEDHQTLAEHLRSLLQPGDVMLIKGSRGARMERILEQL